jgi:hypothetical protein
MTIEQDFERLYLFLESAANKEALSRIEAENKRLRALYDEMNDAWAEDVKRLTAALKECETAIKAMLDEDWPIPRLAARLHRLWYIARRTRQEVDDA